MKKKKVIKWILIVILVVIVAAIGILAFVLFDELKTASSVKTLADGNADENIGNVYAVDISGDYYLDDYVEQGGTKSDKELIGFLVSGLSSGLVNINTDNKDMACTGLSAEGANGSRIFARNYDMKSITNIAIVKTEPGDGKYASIAVADLQMISISKTEGITSFVDKIKCSLSPYVCVDGMNEKGLAVSVFVTKQTGGTDQNTDKPDAQPTAMLRLMLDYCGSVDEAVELASSYDYHDSINKTLHLMVADSTGRSAIIEWINGTESTDIDAGDKRKMVVTYNDGNYQVTANFVNYPGYYECPMESVYSYDRYKKVSDVLETTGGVTNEADVFNTLKSIARRGLNDGEFTIHSVVYDLTNKTMILVDNEYFNDPQHTFKYSLQ